ncbi:flagellar hook-length control protein FliK [Vibrio sp. ZSDE26]|uniref:Flagellar hook-length control protein FliK n=1 Tax=Vibrio amylolyticus TaxID=2847292 RepID=A0A9X1XLI8_9VIBR|nr:flagellar hook-length control protein FliK [Vibrio amylolyticus]MCK6265482.1 flagellar hook-length control protein FliK [Vibrio amylolyticus]
MNINLTTVSDSPKTKSSATVGSDAATNAADVSATESGGFFAAFTSMVGGLIGGEEAAEGSTKESSAKDGKASESSDTNVGRTDKTVADESTDEMLKQANNSDESSEKLKSNQKVDGEPTVKVKDLDVEKQTKEHGGKEASKTVAESDELLDRLNESNKALQAQSGKSLPQEESDENNKLKNSAAVTTTVAVAKSQQDQNVERGAVTTPNSNEDKISVDSANKTNTDPTGKALEKEQLAELPDSVKPFIQKEPSLKDENPQHVQTKPNEVQGDSNSLGKNGVAAAAAKQGVDMIESEQPVFEQANINASKGISEVAPQPTKQGTPQSASNTPEPGLTATEQQALAAASVGAGAIAWSNQTSSEQANAEQVAAQSGRYQAPTQQNQPPQNQAAVAASVQQALNQAPQIQQVQGIPSQALDNMASAMPTDLTQSQLQQLAATNGALPNGAMPAGVHGQANNQAALKAALGLKAADGLTNGQAKDPKDAALAQQIALATGQTQGISPARAEATAQAQLPMQLTREMASDQVAERVQMMMSKNLKNIDIRLDPPELGRMQIRMNMNGDNTTVHFNVSNPQAREVIEQSMPRLREMLAQQGVQLGDTSVQQQSAGQQQSRYAAQENGQSGQGSGNNGVNGEENLDSDTKVDLNVATKRDGISYYA